MNKEKNLIESKSLINTYKRFKFRNYLNKRTLRGRIFFFLKYKNVNLFKLIPHKYPGNLSKILLTKLVLYNSGNFQVTFITKTIIPQKSFIFTILNFIKLYFYNKTQSTYTIKKI